MLGKLSVLIAALLFSVVNVFAQAPQKARMSSQFIELDNNAYLAITLDNDKGWHTYWKNPGDAGLPIKFEFLVNNKAYEKINPLEWPAPKRYLEEGDILAYGYSGNYTFFFEVPKTAINELNNKEFFIKGTWLVCENICIPGNADIKFNFDKNNFLTTQVGPNKLTSEELAKRFEAIPQAVKEIENLEIYLSRAVDEGQLVLHYTLTNVDRTHFEFKSNLLTPFNVDNFSYKREKLFYDQNTKTLYGQMLIDWDGIYNDPVYELPENGVFKKSVKTKFIYQGLDGEKPQVIKQIFKEFTLTGAAQLEEYLKTLTPIGEKTTITASNSSSFNLFSYLVFAFIGGLILNLMPCVLPVISLKLFSLMGHAGDHPKKILRHNIFYSLGVISTFILLGVFVLVLKASGEKIGWGFQLQSPIFVFTMLTIIFIMALNMLGLFEFITPGGRKLGSASLKDNVSGDFFNGVLATILSTPCSAPFLGTALTFAFTTSVANIFLIFIFVGLGLSFPFLLTGFFPRLIAFLPKPGMWMEKLKYILGFTLLLTFVWLYDVLAGLIDFDYAGIYLNTIFASLFFAFFFRKRISKKFSLNLIFFAIPIILMTIVYNQDGLATHKKSPEKAYSSQTLWKPWSKSVLNDLKSSKKMVFMDFTAKWCLTCKVNKKLVLDTESFETLAAKHNLELLRADWTHRDDEITTFLAQYSIVGVPAYFVQMPNGEIKFLGETLSIDKIEKALTN